MPNGRQTVNSKADGYNHMMIVTHVSITQLYNICIEYLLQLFMNGYPWLESAVAIFGYNISGPRIKVTEKGETRITTNIDERCVLLSLANCNSNVFVVRYFIPLH